MSRGPRMRKEVEALIYQQALDNRKTPRRALAVILQDIIKRMGEPPPSEDTLVKMVSRARNTAEDPLDQQWTLMASIEHNLPASATMPLLRVWRLTHALDFPFPVREARWVTYLSTIISDTLQLKLWANAYANHERGHKLAFHGKFDSSNLDAALIMEPGEAAIAAIIGKVTAVRDPNSPMGVMTRPTEIEDLHPDHDAYLAAHLAEYLALNPGARDDPDAGPSPLEIANGPKGLSPLKELQLPLHIVWAYNHWLTQLTKGPKWRHMTRDQIIDIITQLRDWASQLPNKQKQVRQSVEKLRRQHKPVGFSDFPYRTDFKPHDLLQLVGYQPNATKPRKEAAQ